MVGPTGVGKTEVARRMAKLANAPFVKVEATKYTEVGFRGRDVDSIIQDLVDAGIQLMRENEINARKAEIEEKVNERLIDALIGDTADSNVQEFKSLLKDGSLEDIQIDIDISPKEGVVIGRVGNEPYTQGQIHFEDPNVLGVIQGLKQYSTFKMPHKKKRMKLKEARPFIMEEETNKFLAQENLIHKALKAVENDGIVFIDEIDKICGSGYQHHADASTEGVQRDLLPLIEGTIVATKQGNIDTAKILFIASGAFHRSKPSDLLAELLGRLPIRVELQALEEKDLLRILTETENNQIRQQRALLKTEYIDVQFTKEATEKISSIAHEINVTVENIGARRLHTVIEVLMEDINFHCEEYKGKSIIIDEDFVAAKLRLLKEKADLRQFIL
eukprot:TRINITY_DN4135_c0_g1_i2.p1 TRINITY_DN4135_c0_g1~~TRINITY_DN4135_c0_g1_i2.p1  ORF type:complete len:389 (-),score=75.45 TRINITY_DN4135_c0_g1_i2:44-1210(-)